VAGYGKVFNIAVTPLVVAEIETFARGAREARVFLHAQSYNTRYPVTLGGLGWGPHPLLEAAIGAIPPPDDVDIEITIRSDAPPGASTGTSAAVAVALLGALDRLSGGGRTAQQIAYEAHSVETRRLGGESGIQDQLCAALGGVNFIEIVEYPRAVVSRLELPVETRQMLERRLTLIYLGRPHSSSAVHERVFRELEREGPEAPALSALRTAAERARDAAMAGEFGALGGAMRDNTVAQAALHPELVSADAWRVIETAAAHGAMGWKVNGAGGDGGSLTLLDDGQADRRTAMIRAIEQRTPGCKQIPITISLEGLRVDST
jgi:D-glycero-alpha-D-manno-heptose-7-phosphate kinase